MIIAEDVAINTNNEYICDTKQIIEIPRRDYLIVKLNTIKYLSDAID